MINPLTRVLWNKMAPHAPHTRSGLLLRIGAPIVLVSGLLLAVGVVGAWYVLRLQRDASSILHENVASIRAAEELELAVREIRHKLYRYLATGHLEPLDEIPALRLTTEYWMDEAEQHALTPHEHELIAAIRNGYAEFTARYDGLNVQDAGEVSFETMKEVARDVLQDKVLIHTHHYLDYNEQEVIRSSERNKAMADRLALGLFLLGTCGSVAGLVAGYGIAYGINRTIVQLSLPIRDVAGRLNEAVGPITISANPGFHDLEAMLQQVSRRVAAVIKQLEVTRHEALRNEQLAALGQLAAGLAHELRNPLMSMKILVQSAFERADGPGIDRGDLAVLDEEISRLEHLVQTFFDFARPPHPERRRIDLGSVIDQTVSFVAPRAARQGVALRYHPPDEPVFVEADIGQMRQVILNLVLNALDAVPSGGTVELGLSSAETMRRMGVARADASSDASQWVAIRVADTGCGLPPGSGDRIYDPFFSTKETGIGLGLPISKRILEDHGGSIAAADRPEGGAEFIAFLPLDPISRAESADEEPAGDAPPRPDAAQSDGRPGESPPGVGADRMTTVAGE